MAKEQFSRSWLSCIFTRGKVYGSHCDASFQIFGLFCCKGPPLFWTEENLDNTFGEQEEGGEMRYEKRQICCYIFSVSQRERKIRLKKKNKMEQDRRFKGKMKYRGFQQKAVIPLVSNKATSKTSEVLSSDDCLNVFPQPSSQYTSAALIATSSGSFT